LKSAQDFYTDSMALAQEFCTDSMKLAHVVLLIVCYLLRRLIIFNSVRNIIKMLKSRSLRWAGRVAHMEGASNIRNIFVWNCEGRRPLRHLGRDRQC